MMSARVLALFLTLAAAPAFVAAQSQPPAPPAAPAAAPAPPVNPGGPMQWSPEQLRAHMQAMRAHMEAVRHLHEQARAQMLASLSYAHRAAIARIVGNLAISPNPDPRAAAREIDGVLSSSERQAILAAQSSEMQRMRAMMEQMRAQMQQAHAHMQQWMQRMHQGIQQMHQGMQQMHQAMQQRHHRHTPTAGGILLRSLLAQHGRP